MQYEGGLKCIALFPFQIRVVVFLLPSFHWDRHHQDNEVCKQFVPIYKQNTHVQNDILSFAKKYIVFHCHDITVKDFCHGDILNMISMLKTKSKSQRNRKRRLNIKVVHDASPSLETARLAGKCKYPTPVAGIRRCRVSGTKIERIMPYYKIS